MDTNVLEMINRRIDDANINNTKRFDTLEQKVDSLLEFKWHIMGGTALFSAVIGILIVVLTGGG